MSTTSRTRNTTTQSGSESSENEQEFSGATTYGWENMPDTADIAAVRNFQYQSDPRIGYSFARSRRNAAESFANPLGGYMTPQIRDAILRAGNADSSQQEAQAYGEENYARQGLEFAKRANLAELTSPRLVTRGTSGRSRGSASGTSSGTGTSVGTQATPLLPGIIQGVATVGAGYLG